MWCWCSQFSGGGKEWTRVRECKLPGQESSLPSSLTCKCIQEDISRMIASGKLTLGEPCAPYTLTHIHAINGEIMRTSSVVHGQKFCYLKWDRNFCRSRKLLIKFMHLLSDREVNSMSEQALRLLVHNLSEEDASMTTEELKKRGKCCQRSQTIAIWHDHCPWTWVYTHHGTCCLWSNLHQQVKEPDLHLLAVSLSSGSDQLGLIPDRLGCLLELSEPLSGIQVSDTLRFFLGDHPAQQFERSTQQGSRYNVDIVGVPIHVWVTLRMCFAVSGGRLLTFSN